MEYLFEPDHSGLLSFLLAMLGIIAFFAVIGYVINALALMLLFKKAGHPNAWGAWIPIYNNYLLTIFGGQKPMFFWIYLAASFGGSFIPYVGTFISFLASIFWLIVTIYIIAFINNSFGKHENVALWTVFGVLLFPIWALVIALSNTSYFRAHSPLFMNEEKVIPAPW